LRGTETGPKSSGWSRRNLVWHVPTSDQPGTFGPRAGDRSFDNPLDFLAGDSVTGRSANHEASDRQQPIDGTLADDGTNDFGRKGGEFHQAAVRRNSSRLGLRGGNR